MATRPNSWRPTRSGVLRGESGRGDHVLVLHTAAHTCRPYLSPTPAVLWRQTQWCRRSW